MKFFKRLLLSVFSFLFIFVLVSIFASNKVNAATNGIGTINDTYSRTILKDMTYTYTDSNDGHPQKNYVLTYNPATSGVRALAMFGEYEFGGDTISTNVALAQSRGYTVIAGVNASPFDTSNGVTVGTIISDGKIISCNNGVSGYDSFAIRSDGTMFIGRSNLSLSFTTSGGKTITINHINKQKKTENNGVYFFSDDFASDTKTLASSTEVVLTYVSGDMSLGKTLVCKVEKINNSTTRTPIEKGKFVLTASSLADLGYISEGEEVTFSFESNDKNYNWNDVTDSICGFYQILDDGQVMSSIDGDSVVHPRTTIGFKENGEIVLYVVDGRQPNFSIGLSDRACAEYMASLGCVDAIRMDGGGSSAMTVRLPGDTKLTTVNSPSDGGERSDSDCLLIVLKDDYDTTVGDDYLLHAYPNSIRLLANTVTDITVKATDSNYNPKPAPEYTLEAVDGVGEITADKKFKAGSSAKTGSIKVSGGNTSTTVNVRVLDNVDELYCNVNNLALGPNEEYQLSVKAYYQNELLLASNDSFEWSCTEGLGTVDSQGHFTATPNAGVSGYIYASFGSVSAKVLVTIGQLPVEITGFENETCGDGSGEWRNNQINGGTGSCSINTDLQYVRYGSKSLQINFNLANTTGTVGTQIWAGKKIQISGTPTAIGMWVYATPSSQGAWLRMQYNEFASTAAKYADFGHIDWEGWKYLEASIDEGLKFPISVQYLVRIMGVTESERVDGVIYIDQLRAVYGFKNDDFDYPEISNMTPGDMEFGELTTQTISFDITDTGVGINNEATEFYLDGTQITNLITKDIPNGYNVSWTPSALIPLTNGHHAIKVHFEDHAGNFVNKEWDIFIGEKPISFSQSIDNELDINATNKYVISGDSQDFNKIELVIDFDPEVVEIGEIEYAIGLTSTREVVNRTKKTITIYLNNEGYTGNGDLVAINFTSLVTEETTSNFNISSFNFTRDSFAGFTFSQDFESAVFTLKSFIDYSSFVNAYNEITELSFDDLLNALNASKEFDFTQCKDEEVLELYNDLLDKILDYNEDVKESVEASKRASSLASLFGGK